MITKQRFWIITEDDICSVWGSQNDKDADTTTWKIHDTHGDGTLSPELASASDLTQLFATYGAALDALQLRVTAQILALQKIAADLSQRPQPPLSECEIGYIEPHQIVQESGPDALRDWLNAQRDPAVQAYTRLLIKAPGDFTPDEARQRILVECCYDFFSAWFQMPGLSTQQKRFVEECRAIVHQHEQELRTIR